MLNMKWNNALAIGWTRGHDRQGSIKKYHLKTICNCLTSFCGRGFKDQRTGMCNTAPYVLIEYD